jgi:hypothetical protein
MPLTAEHAFLCVYSDFEIMRFEAMISGKERAQIVK